jgi:hypothetical protein
MYAGSKNRLVQTAELTKVPPVEGSVGTLGLREEAGAWIPGSEGGGWAWTPGSEGGG